MYVIKYIYHITNESLGLSDVCLIKHSLFIVFVFLLDLCYLLPIVFGNNVCFVGIVIIECYYIDLSCIEYVLSVIYALNQTNLPTIIPISYLLVA